MPTITIYAPGTAEVDLGNSRALTIAAVDGTAKVYIDYQPVPGGPYTSAVKPTAGYSSPFNVNEGSPKVVEKTDLESEHVRIGTENADIMVTY